MAPRSALASVVSLALATGLAGCNKPKPTLPTAGPPPAARSVGKPLTDEECLAVAEEIGQAVRDGDAAAFDRLIDWDLTGERCTAGIDAPEKYRKDFIKGIKQSQVSGKGISNAIVEAVKKGGSYSLIRCHPRENRPWLLFRLLFPESGLNYHDLTLVRRPDGQIKIVDFYVFMSGEMFSQTVRRGYLMSLARLPGGLLDRLSGSERAYVKYFESLGKMNEARQGGQFAEVLKVYETFPPELKTEKSVLLTRIQAAQSLGDDGEYARALEDYRTAYPTDASIDILSIDYYFLKKRYREAIVCIDRLEQAVQGDPYLRTMRAGMLAEQGDLPAASAEIEKALKADPGLIDAYWGLINISLKAKDHDETLKTLRIVRDKFQLDVGNLAEAPLYKEFVASPQYQVWLKENQAGVGDAGAASPTEKPR